MKAILILAAVLVPAAAVAQSSVTDAEQLARDGDAWMKEGKYEEACDAFTASQRLAPALTTLSSLADCREKNGELASAWTLFLQVEAQTRDDVGKFEVHATALARAKAIEARLSYLTISVAAENMVEDLTVTRNGEPVDAGLWNQPVAVDGGQYTVIARAPGHEPRSEIVQVPAENGRISVDIPKFETIVTITPESTPEPYQFDVKPERKVSPFTVKRVIALGLGAVSLGSFITAMVLSEQANLLRDDALIHCPRFACAEPEYGESQDMLDVADRKLIYAEISLGVAIASLGGTIILWFNGGPDTSDPDKNSGDDDDDKAKKKKDKDDDTAAALAPLVTSHGGGLAVFGRF
jgi:hypothetical protein